MDFLFSHDGHTYRLHTESGDVQCDEIDHQPEEPQPLEPTGDTE